jgi:glycosyltransferase involved in cell wall biosynthesis
MNLPFRPWHALPVWRALREHRPDIVHVNVPGPYSGQMGLIGPIARLSGASRVVATEHLPMAERLWKRALVKRLAAPWTDRVLTIAEGNVPYLTGLQGVAPHKVGVVYNGVQASFGERRRGHRAGMRSRLRLDDATTAVVMVGSLIERKGVGTLLDAVTLLNEPGWKLFFIGTGEDQASYLARASEAGLQDHIEFLGELPATDLEKVLSAMDILVLPSFVEGMPYVILEAMASSLPVVSTPVFGIPEAAVDGETALLVPPGDAGALASAMGRLIRDDELRRMLGHAGRRRFEKLFTLDRHLDTMQRFYTEQLYGHQ